MNEDSYAINARYYDAGYKVKTDLVDLPFYLEEAKRSGGPVLEIGCGTGRISREIARQGIQVMGVDPSPAMLGVFREHLRNKDASLASLIELQTGDLRRLDLKRRFPLVILPFRVLQHVVEAGDQIRAFQAIRNHLADDGFGLFDVFFPKFDRIYSGIGDEFEDFRWSNPDGETVTRSFIKDRFDKVKQTFDARFIYRTFRDSQVVHEEVADLEMVSYTPPQLRILIQTVGLEEIAAYGGFDRSPLDNESSEIIFKVSRAT